MALVFISHAGNDKPLVDALFDLLQTGCDLRREAMFCTSVEGAGIQSGADFIRWIKENMGDAKLVILVLSPNFYASKFCLAEMGAAWSLEKHVFPLMTPEISRDPGVVFLGRQSARMDSTGLDELRDAIASFHPDTAKATSRWSIKKEAFLEGLAGIISGLPKPATVDKTVLEQEAERTAAAKQLYKESEARIRELEEHIRLLEAAKDAAEVHAIRSELIPAIQRFNDLKSNLRTALGRLNKVEIRAVYAAASREPWVPSSEVWERWDSEMTKATQSGWILEVDRGYDATAYVANESHPKYTSIFSDLRELEVTIEQLPVDVKTRIEQEEGCLLGSDNWQFWEEQLLDYALLQ